MARYLLKSASNCTCHVKCETYFTGKEGPKG